MHKKAAKNTKSTGTAIFIKGYPIMSHLATSMNILDILEIVTTLHNLNRDKTPAKIR